MKYLITGGAGFIGSAVIRHIIHNRPLAKVVTVNLFDLPVQRLS